jgi:NTP pyrophosphatase (non-canonical NTP hydrolase)
VENSNQNIEVLKLCLRDFSSLRDWDQFHSVRNLIFALVGEVGELAAEVQWVSDADMESYLADPNKRSAIASEMADILNYLVRLADKLNVDLVEEALKKIDLNEDRYPAGKARGSSAKYTAYE